MSLDKKKLETDLLTLFTNQSKIKDNPEDAIKGFVNNFSNIIYTFIKNGEVEVIVEPGQTVSGTIKSGSFISGSVSSKGKGTGKIK
jgi:hypothetical protein